jgi:hypothetical protein
MPGTVAIAVKTFLPLLAVKAENEHIPDVMVVN